MNDRKYNEFRWWLAHFKAYGYNNPHLDGARYWLDELGGLASVW